MKLRPEHLIVGAGLLIAALIAYAVLFKRVPDVPLPMPAPQAPAPPVPTPPIEPAPVPTPIPPAASAPGPAPAIELSTLDYDMGTIPNDQASNGAVTVFNRGDADLAISRVTASCPCADSKVDPPLIPPDGGAPLTSRRDPEHVQGFESTQHVIAWSNDTRNPHIAVTAKVRLTRRQASDRPVKVLSAKPWRGFSRPDRVA